MRHLLRLLPISLLLLALPLCAAVTLPAIFSDNMVLQQGITAPIWGTAAAGEKITVKLHRQTQRTTAGADSHWLVKLTPEKAGGPFTLTVKGANILTVTNVLVGEVWLCAGQSNMMKAVQEAANWEDEVAHADYPRIRMLTVDQLATSVPADDLVGQWQACSPRVVENWSATAYYFASNLHKALNVPIGIIQASYGGSPVESWLPPAELAKHPEVAMAPDPKLPVVDFAKARFSRGSTSKVCFDIRHRLTWEDGSKVARPGGAPH